MTLATLLLLHGDGRMELWYFWSAILIVLLPMAVFGTLGYLLWRGYRRERMRNADWGMRNEPGGRPAVKRGPAA